MMHHYINFNIFYRLDKNVASVNAVTVKERAETCVNHQVTIVPVIILSGGVIVQAWIKPKVQVRDCDRCYYTVKSLMQALG